MSDEVERLQRRLERERASRKQAERLLEEKSLALYHANQALQASTSSLEQQVQARTQELSDALRLAEHTNSQLRETQRELKQQLFAIDQHTIASIADRDGNIVYANDSFVAISGYSREQLIGANHRIVKSGYHPAALFEGLWHDIAAGKVWSGEVCNRRKDGSLYWVSATIVPFLDAQGLPYQYLSIRTDITPLKQAEASLRKTVLDLNERVKEWTCLNAITHCLQDDTLSDDALLAAVVALIPPGWLVPQDTCARIRYAGHSVVTPGFQETSWAQRATIPKADATDAVEVFRLQLADDEGAAPFLAEEQVLLTGIAAQIGQAMERRHTQRVLRAARDEAQAANRAKSDFLANMSHEIRTPMNGILGMTDLALDATHDDERREYLETVRSSADALLGIINDILDFSKIEAGKLSVEAVDFDLHRLVKEVLQVLALRANDKQLVLRSQVADDVPARVRGDPTRLRQVLLNLVGNAVKFTEHGAVTLSLSGAAPDGSQRVVRFDVHDTGMGIPVDKLDTIFEAFSQADASTTRKFGGTGLGLTITQRLVRLMGGDIGVDSQVGQGSTFHFVLPFEVAALAPLAAAGPRDGLSDASVPAMRVLLVEDHPVNQKLATRLLEKWGHQVVLAHNGQEAVDLINLGERFDVILMDMQMPVMGGIDATRRIRQIEARRTLPRHPIVAMTANAMQGDRELCMEAGMDDYLSKPVRQAELADKLQAWAPGAARVDVPRMRAR